MSVLFGSLHVDMDMDMHMGHEHAHVHVHVTKHARVTCACVHVFNVYRGGMPPEVHPKSVDQSLPHSEHEAHSGPLFTLIWSSFEPSVRSEHLSSCRPRSPASPVAVGIASPHKRCSASFAVHLSSACRRCMVHVDLLRGGVDTTNHQKGY